MRKRVPTFLQAAIPAARGPARHIETDGAAFTRIVDGVVAEVHTPPSLLKRVHEVMHARHSHDETYPSDIVPEVWNLVEDCRLHLLHWPWDRGGTPATIRTDIRNVLTAEKKTVSDNPDASAFAKFAIGLRAQAVAQAANVSIDASTPTTKKLPAWARDLADHKMRELGEALRNMIVQGEHVEAAYMLQHVFGLYPSPEEMTEEEEESDKAKPGRKKRGKGKGRGDATARGAGRTNPSGEPLDPFRTMPRPRHGGSAAKHGGDMEIIELPRIEPTTTGEIRGTRLAACGARIYRPAFRRMVLPQRMFLRNTPSEPGGTILFDASGSMGVNTATLTRCCLASPLATVAYYAGYDDRRNTGWLWIFAKDGMRAHKAVSPPSEGNGVDGLALDWLMNQEGPRILVSDLGFTCSDGVAQVARATTLIEEGEITLFSGYADFLHEYEKKAA